LYYCKSEKNKLEKKIFFASVENNFQKKTKFSSAENNFYKKKSGKYLLKIL
jgi:hypothetical protein